MKTAAKTSKVKTLSIDKITKINEILISKNKLHFVKPQGKEKNTQFVATILKNFESIGYTLSPDFITELSKCSVEYLDIFYENSERALKHSVGAHRKYTPMYPNFPKQVMEASDAELYINAIMHYLGDVFGLRILPEYKKLHRAKLDENLKLKVIDAGDESDVEVIAFNLMSAKTSISETDKETIKWYIKNNPDLDLSKADVTHKEVMSVVVASCIENKVDTAKIAAIPKTVVDIIRIATVMSGGDESLATNTRFKLTRSNRKLLLAMFDNLGYVDQDNLHSYRNKLVVLGEVLHPGEYKDRFKKAYSIFDTVRNKKTESSIGKIEISIAKKDINLAVALLVDKPGVFARRLDHLLRISKKNSVLDQFESIVDKVSTPVLLQVHNHFSNRDGARIMLPKGKSAKIGLLDPHTESISENKLNKVVDIVNKSLLNKFSSLPKMGKVYVDERLKDYPVPFSQRSASKALKTVARGSKISMEGHKKFARLFTWWKDGENRIDIDLAAAFLDSNWNLTEQVTYYNLRADGFCFHSGDITSAPNGACEFIDIDLKAIPKKIRYIVMTIFSYTQQPFVEMPECFAGVMFREDNQKGKIFDARTVEHKFDITSEAQGCVPLIFDVHEKKIIWTDLNSNGNSCFYGGNNVNNNKLSLEKVCQGIATINKFSLYDLFMAHAKSRGTVVDDAKDANVVLSLDNGIQYDFDRIASEFLV